MKMHCGLEEAGGWGSVGSCPPTPHTYLVDEVGRATDVIQCGRLPVPVLELAGVRHEPHVDTVHLGKALDLSKGGLKGGCEAGGRHEEWAKAQTGWRCTSGRIILPHRTPESIRCVALFIPCPCSPHSCLSEHLADVLCFLHERRPGVVKLVVRVHHEATDAVSESRGAAGGGGG